MQSFRVKAIHSTVTLWSRARLCEHLDDDRDLIRARHTETNKRTQNSPAQRREVAEVRRCHGGHGLAKPQATRAVAGTSAVTEANPGWGCWVSSFFLGVHSWVVRQHPGFSSADFVEA